MKLKISETIDASELSSRLEQMIDEVKNKLVSQVVLCEKTKGDIRFVVERPDKAGRNAVTNINLLRQAIFDADLKLEDVLMILDGYNQILDNKKKEQEEESGSQAD